MEKRIAEIEVAAGATVGNEFVPIVPVKMTEAWLLIDVAAIRLAADNPNGRTALELPSLEELEGLKNPKRLLREFLLAASEKSGRRKRQFERDLTRRMVRVSEYIDDFTPLRGLSAFRSFEAAASQAVRRFV